MPGTTPIYGFPYPEPTDLVADYPALGQQLAEDIEAVLPTLGGLSPATPTSIANSGGTATLSGNTVTFSGAVTSLSLNGVFTSTYENYRIVLAATGSTGLGVRIRMRAAGTDQAGATAYRRQAFLMSGSTTITGIYQAGDSAYLAEIVASLSLATCDVGSPYGSTKTMLSCHSTADTVFQMAGMVHGVAASYDGFSIFTSTGTMTGTVSVYGYRP